MSIPTGLPVMVATFVDDAVRNQLLGSQPPSMLTPLLALVMLRLVSAYVDPPETAARAITLRLAAAAAANPPFAPPRVAFGRLAVRPLLALLPDGDTNTVLVGL